MTEPLEKYDKYVEAREGRDPKSREWERRHHSNVSFSWGGHCNGWAADALLNKFPSGPRYDQKTGQVILASDFHAMNVETHYCVDYYFYGRRNYKRSPHPLADFPPNLFHDLLRRYIKEDTPVVVDVFIDDAVDNHIISGYDFISTEKSSRRFQIDNIVTLHRYSYKKIEKEKIATSYEKTYSYFLDLDERGNIISGEWISDDPPDFLWVPLRQSNCGNENPLVDPKIVSEMQRTLLPI